MADGTAAVWARVLEELGGRDLPEKLKEYIEELSKWGERIHLTGRERMAEAVAAQVADSLAMLELAGAAKRAADIGSGAGFPGMVWKIARPGMEVVLFERKERLAVFLDRTARLLGLGGLTVRAEDAARFAGKAGFDVVTSKAAGRLGEILPVAGRLLSPGGVYITAKGGSWRSELHGTAGFRLKETARLRKGRGEAISLVLDA